MATESQETTIADPAQGTSAEGGGGDRLFTQEEVNRIVKERLARARPADYDEIKAELEQLRNEKLSEKERAEKERDDARAEVERLRGELDAARGEAQAERIRNAVLAEAARQGAIDPSDVVALLPSDSVTIGDDGQVAGAQEAVKALLAAKPHLVGSRRPSPDPGQGKQTGTESAVDRGRARYRERRPQREG